MSNLNQNSLKNSIPKTEKTSPQKKFIYYSVITVFILGVSFFMLTSDDLTLSELSAYEGKLTEINVTTTRRDLTTTATPIMVFTLDGLDAKLGIGQNAPADFSVYTNNLKPGDIVKVYYDSHPYLTPEGYNPFVYQLEKNGVLLLDLNSYNRSNKLAGYIALGFGALALLGTFFYYRKNIAKSHT